jgi:hypothetical protein
MCAPTSLADMFFCVFLHAFGYNFLILGIVLLIFVSILMYKMNLPSSVALPAFFGFAYALFVWEFAVPEFRIAYYLAGGMGSAAIAYVFLKFIKK